MLRSLSEVIDKKQGSVLLRNVIEEGLLAKCYWKVFA